MRFPGRRKKKHYFPIEHKKGRASFGENLTKEHSIYVAGIDQLIVDIEAHVSEEFLNRHHLKKGDSMVVTAELMETIHQEAIKENAIIGEFAGGIIGNTLHNYSVISDAKSILLGSICREIKVNDYAFKYLRHTDTNVMMECLRPYDGPMARALCMITPDGERTFILNMGCMNEFGPEFVPESVVVNSSALLVSAYLFRDESSPIFQATMKAINLANDHQVPVILAMGTSSVIAEKREFLVDIIKNKVNVIAMNETEAEALTGENDPLMAGRKALEIVDVALITNGARGLYLCGVCDEKYLRKTTYELHTKAIKNYNEFEFSRCMKRNQCQNPVEIFTHVNPYMGGPGKVTNTNGAGDGALSAVIHDLAANCYHRKVVPNSEKHVDEFLTYSSIAQISKYANRISYEILKQNSPRLARALPEKEDVLEEKNNHWSN